MSASSQEGTALAVTRMPNVVEAIQPSRVHDWLIEERSSPDGRQQIAARFPLSTVEM
jgi:hypothetical protein